MARARKKAPRQEAPQSIEQATALAARYVYLLNLIDDEKTSAQAAIDNLRARLDEEIKPREEELKAIFRQLRPWWAANKDELTDGKRKSIELAGAQLGERTTTPALSLPAGTKQEDFAARLHLLGFTSLVRVKMSIDKPACIKALRWLDREPPQADVEDKVWHEDQLQRSAGEDLAAKGAKVTQKDEFFIDRALPRPEGDADVEVESEGDAASITLI